MLLRISLGLTFSIVIVFFNVRGENINCNGKGFVCKNSTHFLVCVDMGAGLVQTVDTIAQKCPENSFCDDKNLFECSERSNATKNGTKHTSLLKLNTTLSNTTAILVTAVSPVIIPSAGPTVYRSCINGVSTLADVSTVFMDSIALPSITIPCVIPFYLNQNQYSACQKPGQYPDAKNCQSYFSCNNNMMYRFNCPFNMVYSPSQLMCTTSKEECSNSDVFTCNSVGRFPDSKSCYSYYACQGSGYAATRYHCPWYSSFQPTNGHCVKTKTTCDCRQASQKCPNPPQYPPTPPQNPAPSPAPPQYPTPPQYMASPQYTAPSQYPSPQQYPVPPQYPTPPQYIASPQYTAPSQSPSPQQYTVPPQYPILSQYPNQIGERIYYGNSYQSPSPASATRDVPADHSNILYTVAPVDNNNNYFPYNRPHVPVDNTNPVFRYNVPDSSENTRYSGEAVGPIRYNFIPIDSANSIQQPSPVYSPPSTVSLDRVETSKQRTPAPTDSSIGYASYSGEVDSRGPPYIQGKWSQPVMNDPPAFQQWSSTYFGSSNWWSVP